MGKVAIVQMVSVSDVQYNLAELETVFAEASINGTQLIVLPENFAFMGIHDSDKIVVAEQYGDGMIQNTLSILAKRYQLWIIAGTIPIKTPNGRVWASSLVYDANGYCVARYDKIHLFDVVVSGHEAYNESNSTIPGQELVVIHTPIGNIGLSVCYDVRFPELYRLLIDRGAEILAIPAAFTATTGRAHWHVLVRARAIENMCYVLAANQGGIHANGRETYGHSLIVNPWGKVMAEIEQGRGVIYADIDLNQLHQQRKDFPCIHHRALSKVSI